MSKTREEVEDGLLGVSVGDRRFLDFCEDKGGQMDQRLENIACAFGPGEIHFDQDDDVSGDLVVISQRSGKDLSVNHYVDGEQIREGSLFLEGVSVDEDGDLSGELGDLSGF